MLHRKIIKKIIFGLLVCIIAGGIFFFAKNKEQNTSLHQGNTIRVDKESIAASALLGDGFLTYADPLKRFSVEYPKDLLIKRFEESEGAETVVFQGHDDTPNTPQKQKRGFQIFITPFEGEFTRERIVKDIPGLLMEEITEVIIGGKVHALLFWSNDQKLGRTREVWFSDGKVFLYEVTTYEHFDNELAKILSTWRFYST